MNTATLWARYRKYVCVVDSVSLSVDISRMHFDEEFLARMAEPLARAFNAMDALENGSLANPDERRMVGHYWLRAPQLAPTHELTDDIIAAQLAVHSFVADVHRGRTRPQHRDRFRHLLLIGIGGSALGPQFVSSALGTARDPITAHYFDNTDPDGMHQVLARLGDELAATMTIVISKSGGTKETRNGMLIAAQAYRDAGLEFAKHAVAITARGSELDRTSQRDQWLERFPMWDWVGGRTSVLSVVGLLPAALQGVDIDALLGGARDMDVATRNRELEKNPAALLALMWHCAGDGRGAKDMVVLPYKDRLLLLSRYLQQLVMESLGKAQDVSGNTVHQGITVYGNKGSTDQHAYVQQLRDGVDNFFVTFIQVLRDQEGVPQEVEKGVTAGDYLLGFLLGTREALFERRRESITITVDDVSPRALGALIALYERAVGLYASLVNINAYHQPGVEAGKSAAIAVIALQQLVTNALRRSPTSIRTAAEIAHEIAAPERVETVYKVLEHLAANGRALRVSGVEPTDSRFSLFRTPGTSQSRTFARGEPLGNASGSRSDSPSDRQVEAI